MSHYTARLIPKVADTAPYSGTVRYLREGITRHTPLGNYYARDPSSSATPHGTRAFLRASPEAALEYASRHTLRHYDIEIVRIDEDGLTPVPALRWCGGYQRGFLHTPDQEYTIRPATRPSDDLRYVLEWSIPGLAVRTYHQTIAEAQRAAAHHALVHHAASTS